MVDISFPANQASQAQVQTFFHPNVLSLRV
jgi:hypothetical protein